MKFYCKHGLSYQTQYGLVQCESPTEKKIN